MSDLNFSQWIETDLQSEIFGFNLGIKLGDAQMLLYRRLRGEMLTDNEMQQLQRFDLKHAENPKWLQLKAKIAQSAASNSRPTYQSNRAVPNGNGNSNGNGRSDMRWIG